MPESTIEDRVKVVLTREGMVNKRVEEIDNEASLVDTYGLDSIQIIELIAGLEDEFGVTLEDEELGWELFENVNSLATFVRKKLETSES